MTEPFQFLVTLSPYMILVLRVAMGLNFFVGRGYRHLFTERKETLSRWEEQGVPRGATFLAAILNSFGALCLIIGLLVPIVALFFGIEMVITALIQKYRLKSPYFGHAKHGYEINILYLLIALALVFFGAGPLSVDSLIGF